MTGCVSDSSVVELIGIVEDDRRQLGPINLAIGYRMGPLACHRLGGTTA